MKNSILQLIVSVYFWFIVFFIAGICFLLALVICLLTFWFDRNRKILHRFTCIWSDLTFALNPVWKIRVTGRSRIRPGMTYVMVANHQSGADIMALFSLNVHFKWVAKKTLFYVPFIGWNMYLNRYIAIERSQGRSKLRMMDRAAEAIRKGNSVMIFPEGTRSRDGQVHTFKSGAFRLAMDMRTYILPIAIHGTFKAIRKGGFRINVNKDIRVMVLDPIPFAEFADRPLKEVTQLAEDRIRKAWESVEQRCADPVCR